VAFIGEIGTMKKYFPVIHILKAMAFDFDSLNYTVQSTIDIDNGSVFSINTEVKDGIGKVSIPKNGELNNLWMANSIIPFPKRGWDKDYLHNNKANEPFDAIKLTPHDIIYLSENGIMGKKKLEYVQAVDQSYKLKWSNDKSKDVLTLKYIKKRIITTEDYTNTKILGYRFMVVGN